MPGLTSLPTDPPGEDGVEPNGGAIGTTPDRPRDVAWGAFSDHAPWVVDPEGLPWQATVPGGRELIARTLPDLTRRRLLPPGRHIVRTTRILGGAVGRWYLGSRRIGGSTSRADLAHRLRLAAERLGPTYIKLGQIISSGQGLFPAELVEEFARCRDRVPPERFAAIRQVIEEDLGRPLHEVFAHIERRPIAAASIAQVHAATLCTGEAVVVKVQRPAVYQRVHADLRVMAWLAPFLVGRIPVAALANPPALVDLFAETITEELDFRLEADNMVEIARSYAALDQRGYVIPRPHPTLVTERVLVMERLEGFAFDDVVGMREAGIDTDAVVRTGMIGFLEGAMFNGIFHGDLHGGNLLVLADGRTGLLDFGITGRLPQDQRLAFLRLLVGASMNDVVGQLGALRDLGALPPHADLASIVVELGLDKPPIDPTTLSADELTGEIQRVLKALLGYGARMPKPLMLFVKNLVFLDGAITTLAPDLDLFAEITAIAMYFTTRHGERIASEVGLGADDWSLDLSGVKAGFGVDTTEVETLTHRDLRQRRQEIADRFEQQSPRRRPRGRRRRQ
jgi:ubiquinone biosynthesis protein